MFKVPNQQHRIRTIRQDDPDFTQVEDYMVFYRAGFEISPSCPSEYRMILQECINNRWLRPVAYMKESEYAWEKLKDR